MGISELVFFFISPIPLIEIRGMVAHTVGLFQLPQMGKAGDVHRLAGKMSRCEVPKVLSRVFQDSATIRTLRAEPIFSDQTKFAARLSAAFAGRRLRLI
jgi:hypothetical protein